MDAMPEATTAIDWRTWSTEAFSHAHAKRRPVLLAIGTTWSAACRAMDREVYADERVAALLRDRVVAVRVDADRRPDIADRYGAGGWPTTLLLTADGDPLCGGTYIDADRLAATIADVADRCQRDADDIRRLALAARAARATASYDDAHAQVQPRAADHAPAFARRDAREAVPGAQSLSSAWPSPDDATNPAPSPARDGEEDAAVAWIAACVLREYDAAHAGFGTREKFPLVAPIAFALRHGHRQRDESLLELSIATLDRIGWGGLSADSLDAQAARDVPHRDAGAFHRACANPDWSDPDRAHLLEIHADLIRLFLDAWTITGFDRYRDRALAAWAWIDRTLHDTADDEGPARGGFFASEADGEVDRVLLTDANAKTIRALLRLSHVLDDPRYAECAARAAERLMPAVYGRGAGVAHVLDARSSQSRVRGLLTDQVHASAALLDLGLVAADRAYLDLAEELMRSCLRKLWDASRGAFVDRLPSSAGAGDVGLLGEPLHPFALNAEAARLLDRLGRHTDHAEFTERAADVRGWLARHYQQQGIASAEYGVVLVDHD